MSTWDNAAQIQPSQSPAELAGARYPKVAVREVDMVVVEVGRDALASRQPIRAAHDPYMRFGCRISSIAELEDDEEKTSIIMVDDRDERIVSPFRHGSCARSSQTLPTR